MSPEVLIVGAGACGALVAQRLAARGFSVVVLEAGKRYQPATDLQNSEANAGKILWTEPRNFVGKSAVMPKTGVGVGGGTLPWRETVKEVRSSSTEDAEAPGTRLSFPCPSVFSVDSSSPFFAIAGKVRAVKAR